MYNYYELFGENLYHLGHVIVHLGISVVTGKVVTLDKGFDPLLD